MLKKKKIIILTCLLSFLIFSAAIAAEPAMKTSIKLQVKIPGLEGTITGPQIGVYINAIYNFAVGAVGILAVVMIMWAGFLWMTARGNAEQVSKAKGYMSGAMIGLVLALGAYLILSIVNPDVLNLEWPGARMATPSVPKVPEAEEQRCERLYGSSCTLIGTCGDNLGSYPSKDGWVEELYCCTTDTMTIPIRSCCCKYK